MERRLSVWAGLWLSMLVTVSAFGQTGGVDMNVFRLYDIESDTSYVELPRKLRLRCTYYLPVGLVSAFSACNGVSGQWGRAVTVSAASPALTGDEAMAAMPVFRGEAVASTSSGVQLQTITASVYSSNGSANGNASSVNTQTDAASLSIRMMCYDGRLIFRWPNVSVGALTTDPREWWGYQGANFITGDPKDLPLGHNELRIGMRWEYTTGEYGLGSEIRVYIDGRTIERCINTVPSSDTTTLSGSVGVEKLWLIYALEQDPGEGVIEYSEDLLQAIVDNTEATVDAVQQLQVVVSSFRTDFINWRETWDVWTAATSGDLDTIIETLQTIAMQNEPPEGGGTVPTETDPDLPGSPPAGLIDDEIGDTLQDHGITGLSETHVPPGGPPVWSWTLPMGDWSTMMGGPALNPLTVTADFAPLAPFRLIIHSIFYMAVGVWACCFLFEELRKY